MMNQRCIVAIDGDRCIVQRGQQILLSVANFGRVLLEAGNHELNMMGIELEKTRTDNLCRVLRQLRREVSLSRVRVFALPVATWYLQLEFSLSSFRRIMAYPLQGSSYRNVPVGLDIQFSRISEKAFSVLKNPLTDSEFQRGAKSTVWKNFFEKKQKNKPVPISETGLHGTHYLFSPWRVRVMRLIFSSSSSLMP